MMGKDFSKTRILEVRKAEINSHMTEIYTHKLSIVYTWDYKKSIHDLRTSLETKFTCNYLASFGIFAIHVAVEKNIQKHELKAEFSTSRKDFQGLSS